MEHLPIVYLDIETSGFSQHTDEILQIAAKFNNKEFNTYILPTRCFIHPKATKHTGISIHNDKMYVRGQEVFPTTIQDALNRFIFFLNSLSEFKVILAAHNGYNFDIKFLLRDAYRYNFDIALKSNVFGFIDTLDLIKGTTKRSHYNLESLALDFVPSFDPLKAHNAIHDARYLRKLIQNMEIKHLDLINNVITFDQFEKRNIFSA